MVVWWWYGMSDVSDARFIYSTRVIVSGRLRITTNLFYGHLLKPSKMLPVRVFYFNVVTKSAPYESPQSIRFMWAHSDRSERVRGHTALRLRVVEQVSSVTFGVPKRTGRAQKSPDGIGIATHRSRGSVEVIWHLPCCREASVCRAVD